jgi:hypothetical protein
VIYIVYALSSGVRRSSCGYHGAFAVLPKEAGCAPGVLPLSQEWSIRSEDRRISYRCCSALTVASRIHYDKPKSHWRLCKFISKA